jgi:hypothetical protein
MDISLYGYLRTRHSLDIKAPKSFFYSIVSFYVRLSQDETSFKIKKAIHLGQPLY